MDSKTKITLDYIDQISIIFDNTLVSYQKALDYTAKGILFQANLMKTAEDKYRNESIYSKYIQDKNCKFVMFKSSAHDEFLPNIFNWFSVSVASYCRTVKTLDLLCKNKWTTQDLIDNNEIVKKMCSDYVKDVVPEIYLWRNKIGAHFSITDPKEKDTVVDLEYSINTPVSWKKDHFCVGLLSLIKDDKASTIPEWSITEVLEKKLIPRFWPNMVELL